MSEPSAPTPTPSTGRAARRPRIGPDDVIALVEAVEGDQARDSWAVEVKPHRSARRKARKYALDVLYAAEVRAEDPLVVVDAPSTSEAELPELTRALVVGVAEHGHRIDAIIAQHLPSGWGLRRMPRLDRCLAQLAVYELVWTLTAADVVIAEAVALASELSTDDSPGFLAGLLGAIAADASPVVD